MFCVSNIIWPEMHWFFENVCGMATGIARAMFTKANACTLSGPSASWEYYILSVLCVYFCWVINIYITIRTQELAVRMTHLDADVSMGHSHASASAQLFIFTGACYLYETQPCYLMKFCLFRKADFTMLCLILLN